MDLVTISLTMEGNISTGNC